MVAPLSEKEKKELEKRYPVGGYNEPPADWTPEEFKAFDRANRRLYGCLGLVTSGLLLLYYLSTHAYQPAVTQNDDNKLSEDKSLDYLLR